MIRADVCQHVAELLVLFDFATVLLGSRCQGEAGIWATPGHMSSHDFPTELMAYGSIERR